MATARIAKRVTRSKETRWDVKYRLGNKDYTKSFRTKAEAELFRAQTLTETVVVSKDERTTLREAFERFLEVREMAGRATTTIESFKYRFSHLEALEDLPIQELTVKVINRHFESLRKKGVSSGVMNKVQILLRGIIQVAIDEETFSGDNPMVKAARVKAPPPSSPPAALTPEEFKRLLKEIPAYHRPGFLMMAVLGLRRGEAEALKRSDFSDDFSTVHISRTKTNSNERTTKTPKSNRVLKVPKFIQEELKKTKPHGTDQRMTRVNNNFHKVLDPACERAGVPRLTCHDLRDVAAGMLLRNGLDLAALSKVLGHANVRVTAERYLGTLDDSSERAATLLDSLHAGDDSEE